MHSWAQWKAQSVQRLGNGLHDCNSIPGRSRDISFAATSGLALRPIVRLPGSSYLGAKSSAEVTNTLSYASTPPYVSVA
jgi:hypothetical protein